MKAYVYTALVAALSFGTGGIAQAKSLSRIIAEMGLSPADFEVLSATSNALLSSGSPSIGQERAWLNQDTGSKGTVRVQNVQDNCVILQHVVQPEGAEQTRDIRTRRCKTADGNWILTP
ncbi:hypothetical protein SAMN05444358_1011611 [Ruegeria halocynthiae]|uniref:Outer membrane surface antigen n=1 Tax=Ruegeria halocynthiae TaxID=985054 RepID=A0A1H2VXL1_9RHOB|nr:hypothetical protein [Ruegeria halocynthiae]SDW73070.1 hypothetical protein SAMN05444358_1011611 [Ruegeria halocynthiae]